MGKRSGHSNAGEADAPKATAFVLKVPMHCRCDGCNDKIRAAVKDLTLRCEGILSLDQSALSTKGELAVVATTNPKRLRRRLRKATGKDIALVFPKPPGKPPAQDEVVIPIEDDERTKDEAKRKEKKEQQRKQYMKWRMCFSFSGHCFLFALSFIPGLGEGTSGHEVGETSKKWLNWGVTGLIAPLLLLGVMIIIQAFYIDLEDISEDKETVKRCKRVNLAMISISKIVYFAIREAPGCANVKGRGIAHAIAFAIDMVGAIYLYRNHSCYELDNV